MGIGQGVAEPCLIGKKPNQPTGADSIMPTIPPLEDQQAKRKERPTECVKRDIFEDLCEVKDCLEGDNTCTLTSPPVKGRLCAHISFWQKIGAPNWILSILKEGYRLPFVNIPPGNDSPNNKSVLPHGEFVDQAMWELLATKRVVEVKEPPYIINPLSVTIQRSRKKRLVLDLRHVNYHLAQQKFKYEDWKVGLSYFQKGAYMFSFDLKSRYHHIDIHSDYQQFLGFAWTFSRSGQRRYFVFTVLPFSLSSAPYIFTKVLKPLVKYWRINGLKLGLFLDDGWGIEKDKHIRSLVSKNMQSDLQAAELIANNEKCQWELSQVVEWLGLVWNAKTGTICITENRIQNIIETLRTIVQKEFFATARGLASLVGKIISASAVFGNISQLMTRYCSIEVAAAADWETPFLLLDFIIGLLLLGTFNSMKKNNKDVLNVLE